MHYYLTPFLFVLCARIWPACFSLFHKHVGLYGSQKNSVLFQNVLKQPAMSCHVGAGERTRLSARAAVHWLRTSLSSSDQATYFTIWEGGSALWVFAWREKQLGAWLKAAIMLFVLVGSLAVSLDLACPNSWPSGFVLWLGRITSVHHCTQWDTIHAA